MRKGVIEVNLPRRGNGMITDDAFELIIEVARESQRPVTWLSLLDVPGLPENGLQQTMQRFEPAFKSGLVIRPQTTCRPIKLFITLREPFVFASFPSWKPAFNRSKEEQVPLYRSKEFRDLFKSDLSRGGGVAFRGKWALLEIARVEKAENQRYVGKSVQDLADMLHKDPVDAMLDLALEEGLATGFRLSAANYLAAFATCCRAYHTQLKLPDIDFPWETPELVNTFQADKGAPLTAFRGTSVSLPLPNIRTR